MNTKCSNCKNLHQSVYMKLDDEILYNCWCKVGDMENGTCNKFITKNNLPKANKVNFNCKGEKYGKYNNVIYKRR